MGMESASSRAYEYITQRIASGEFAPGEPLSEVDIANALNLSRSPVREALKKMEAEGQVKHYAGRGTFVTVLTEKDLREIFQLRLMFELCGLESAIAHVSDEVLESMREEFREAFTSGDTEACAQADTKLHAMIIHSSGNARLQNFMDVLSAQNNIAKAMSRKVDFMTDKSYETHVNILEAIQARDLELAKRLLEAHIRSVEERTIRSLTGVDYRKNTF